MTTFAEELRLCALCQTTRWHSQQLARFFPQAKSPQRAAEAWAARQEAQEWLCSADLDACLPTPAAAPLCRVRPGDSVDFDWLENVLKTRWAIVPQRVRVYWPSRAFGRRFGCAAGTDSLTCPHKVGHDLMCTWVWLRYLAVSESVAVKHWQPEWRLVREAQARGSRESIPDALVTFARLAIAIEICGQYGAALLRKRWERIRRQMSARYERWHWELW
jgi:hypothetical protein